MCLHQVDPDLQWFPHKSDEPVYWALLLVSLSAWPVCFIRWIHSNRLYLACNAKACLCPWFVFPRLCWIFVLYSTLIYSRTALLVTNYVDFACCWRHVCDFSSWPIDFSVWFDSEELERPQWGWEDISMAVSTQLGLLLWKNFTYRRRQTVSTTAARHHRVAAVEEERLTRYKGKWCHFRQRRKPHIRPKMSWCHIFTRHCPESIVFWFMPAQHYANQLWLPGHRTVAPLCAGSLFSVHNLAVWPSSRSRRSKRQPRLFNN